MGLSCLLALLQTRFNKSAFPVWASGECKSLAKWLEFALVAEDWSSMARDARKAANRLVGEHFRSCLNRAYYAAYAKVTHELCAIPAVRFAAGDEGPRHPGRTGTGGIRRLIDAHMTTMDRARREKLSELVGRLYTLRCVADYHPSIAVDGRDAREGVSIMNTIFDAF